MGCTSLNGHSKVTRTVIRAEKLQEYVARILEVKAKYPENCMA
jgi:hypothetical protein